jgi:hypothetical protein
MIVNVVRAALVGSLLAGAAQAAVVVRPYDGNCGTPVATADDAMAKADFVIEGTVVVGGFTDVAGHLPSVTIEKSKVIRQQSNRVANNMTLTMAVGPCFAPGLAAFITKGIHTQDGKRLRFFGNEHKDGPGRRFFFMQPADMPMPVAKRTGTPWATVPAKATEHGRNVAHPLADGWHRATSTEGKYLIDMPAPYLDATIIRGKDTNFIISATDAKGNLFTAEFARSQVPTELADMFDFYNEQPKADRTVFRGLAGVQLREVDDAGRVTNSLLVRVPGGTFLLSVASSKANEADTDAARTRFFESIDFGS